MGRIVSEGGESEWKTAPDNITEETIVLEETGFGVFQVKVRSGCSTFFVDEPFGAGGLASGPNPYDLLSAAIGACSLMTMRLYATEHQMLLETIRIRVTHRRSGLEGRDLFVKEIELTGDLTDLDKEQVVAVSDRCPVQTTMARGSNVETVLLPNRFNDATATTRYEHMRDMYEAVQQKSDH